MPGRFGLHRLPSLSRRAVWLLIGAVVVLAASGVAAAMVLRPTPLDQAQAVLADDDRFVRARDAALAFGHASDHLKAAAEDCGDDTKPRCANLYSAAAYTRITAALVLRCSRGQVFDARATVRSYVDALASGEDVDDTPPVITCT